MPDAERPEPAGAAAPGHALLALMFAIVCVIWAGVLLNLFGETAGVVAMLVSLVVIATVWRRSEQATAGDPEMR